LVIHYPFFKLKIVRQNQDLIMDIEVKIIAIPTLSTIDGYKSNKGKMNS